MGGTIPTGRPISRLMFSVRNHKYGVFVYITLDAYRTAIKYTDLKVVL